MAARDRGQAITPKDLLQPGCPLRLARLVRWPGALKFHPWALCLGNIVLATMRRSSTSRVSSTPRGYSPLTYSSTPCPAASPRAWPCGDTSVSPGYTPSSSSPAAPTAMASRTWAVVMIDIRRTNYSCGMARGCERVSCTSQM